MTGGVAFGCDQSLAIYKNYNERHKLRIKPLLSL